MKIKMKIIRMVKEYWNAMGKYGELYLTMYKYK